MDEIQQAVIGLELSAGVGELCPCKRKPRTVRCLDCFQIGVRCMECIISMHSKTPFHRLKLWNGFYFDRLRPKDIGFSIELGHDGVECTSRSTRSTMTTMSIINTNGVHVMEVGFCECYRAPPRWKQLINAGLFPSTIERPETAFTVPFMKLVHLLSTIGHMSAMDLTTAIRRMTNGAFTASTPVSNFPLSNIQHLKEFAGLL